MAKGETYEEFVGKFEPKRTTDDCHTPPDVYDAVAAWVSETYGVDLRLMVRPFWPGSDYESLDYPHGCSVVDNPPFSILSDIKRFYNARGIPYFLFAPHLTVFSSAVPCSYVVTGSEIVYENGARVRTSFVTNMDRDYLVRTAPELRARVDEVQRRRKEAAKKTFPKYSYPMEVLTASRLDFMSKHGIDFRVRPEDADHITQMDAQRPLGKSIFGNGLLLSERAAAERAAAERAAAERAAAERAEKYTFRLSERERDVVRSLGMRA